MTRAAATLHFSEILLTLLKGKASLLDALNILCRDGIKKQVQESTYSLLFSLKKGKSFSDGLRTINCGKVRFEPLYLTLIDAGEATANIENVLERIVIDLKRKKKAKENVINIMIYPVLIILLAIIGTFFILFKGLPLFISGGLISPEIVSDAIFGVILAGFIMFFGASVILAVYIKIFNNDSPEFRVFYLLDLLLHSNITLSQALSHCIAGFEQTKIAHSLVKIKKDISIGVSFSTAFSNTNKFSPYVLGWLQIADRHGNLLDICSYIKEHYAEKDQKTREFAAKLLEPIIIILTGIYLLIIMLNVVLPILTLTGGIL